MDIKSIIVILAVVVLMILFVRFRKRVLMPFIVALIVSVLWTLYYRYEYTGANIFLFNRINVYPLALWTLGLTGLHLAHARIKRLRGLFVATVVYLAVLAAVEAIGYHLLNIRLVSNYTSLLGLGVIHAPLTMKIFYVLAGPVYMLLNHGYRNSWPQKVSNVLVSESAKEV